MKLEYHHLNWIQLIWDTGMSTKSKITCAALAAHMNANHHIAWPSISRLAAMTGLSTSSVKRAVKEIEEAGWLVIERGGINKGTSRYTPIFPPEIEAQLGSQGHQTGVTLTPAGVTVTPALGSHRHLNQSIESVNNKKTLPHPPDEGDSALWKTFWQLYPRKADKIGARKRWTKLTSAEHKLAIEDIKAGRFRHADKNFIPYPGSYLNGKRWEDEREPSGPRAPGAAAHKPFEEPPQQSAEDKLRAAAELERLQSMIDKRG